jgi:Protein of unknown function (DUF3987)
VKDKGDDEAALVSKKQAVASKRAEFEALRLPAGPPQLLDDATPEAVARALTRSGGVGAIISAEGSAFANQARGQYSSGKSNLGLFCKAYDAEPYRVDRVQREAIVIERALMTICVAVQPSVLRELCTEDIRGQGLFARFLFAKPPSNVGRRKGAGPRVPEAIKKQFEFHVGSMLSEPMPPEPRELWFSAAARVRLEQYAATLEPRLAGDLQDMQDYGGKHAGRVIRMSGLLHLADNAGSMLPQDELQVSAATVERAIAIADYFLAEAIDVYGDASAGKPAAELDQFATQIKAKFATQSFDARELAQQRFMRGTPTTTIRSRLDQLVEDGTLQVLPPTPPRTTAAYRF